MPRALYVITRAQRRGAEVDATLLAEHLAPDYEPLVVTVHPGGDPGALGSRVPVTPAPAAAGPLARVTGVSRPAVRHIAAALRDFGPDLVVAYGGEPLLHAVRAARRGRVPVLYVKISMAAERAKRGARRAVIRRAIARAEVVCAVAPHLEEELRRDFGVEGPIHVTPTFRPRRDVPPARQRDPVRRELGIADDQMVAAFVGSLSPEKGPDLALEAVARSRRRVVLLVAGDGAMRRQLEARAERRDLAGRVRFLGPRGDVPRLLAAADLVLLTSREEGRPGVLLEAALGGLPVVAMAVGGVPDLVRHREEGLLVPPGDHESAANALNELLADPDLRRSLGAAALARGKSYLPEAALPAWRAAFEAALRRKPTA